MDHFRYVNGTAHCENVPLEKIANAVGTPAYVYSVATLIRHCTALKQAFKSYPTLPCYAVKANSNLSILKEVFNQGFGADVVSIGELERALLAGAKPEQIVYSGVGKRVDEITRALNAGILSFNLESAFELDHIRDTARACNKVARLCIRINPNIDAKTHPKIATGLYSTKFGMAEESAKNLLKKIQGDPNLKLVGLACHIGSQIVDIKPLQEAAARMRHLAEEIIGLGFPLEFLNMGGGLGIRYNDETPPSLDIYANSLIEAIKPTGLKLVIEPGRVIMGNVGIIITKCIGSKANPEKTFVIVDAAMNDLLRPSIYGSFHDILTVNEKDAAGEKRLTDIVGPVCETGDFIGRDRLAPQIKEGSLLFVRSCGAYAASMASNYNSRPRAVEVLVRDQEFFVVKQREKLAALWADELDALKKSSS